jgi:hypothetical protein
MRRVGRLGLWVTLLCAAALSSGCADSTTEQSAPEPAAAASTEPASQSPGPPEPEKYESTA